MALSTEKKKQIAAGVLGCLALLTVTYTLFFSDDAPSSGTKSSTAQSGKKIIPGVNAPINAAANTTPQQNAQITLVSQPLELQGLGGTASPVIGRNIFIYPTPPPIPTPKPPSPTPPPPPPPITLGGMDPSNRIARTTDFPLTVFGAKIPPDAQVLVNGTPMPSTVVNDQQIKTNVSAQMIANPGAVQIEVKSASDPVKWYSNRLTLSISPPPVPQFKYLGIIVKNGISTAYIRDESESDAQAVKKGQKIGSRWEVTNISPNEIEITDIQIKIKHHIALNGEGS